MNLKISIIFLTLFLLSCGQEKVTEDKSSELSYLLEAEDVLLILQRPNIKVIDFRQEEDYLKGHIPGALNIWRGDIEDTTCAYEGMMGSVNQIESLFSKLGISSVDTLLIYDDNGLLNASRLWWILQAYDCNRVALMQGGKEAWKKAGGIVTDVVPIPVQAEFTLTDTPSMKYYLSKEDVQEAITAHSLILDTRTSDEFSGKIMKKGASKAGRIPGSVHIDWTEAIDYHGTQRLKTLTELDSIYSQLNISKDAAIIVYCHSGVRAAHTAFVLTQLLGYTNVKNYDGSWTEWSYFEELPFESDSFIATEK